MLNVCSNYIVICCMPSWDPDIEIKIISLFIFLLSANFWNNVSIAHLYNLSFTYNRSWSNLSLIHELSCGIEIKIIIAYIYSPKKETQHVKKLNLFQIFNIILNIEISITLHWNLAHWLFRPVKFITCTAILNRWTRLTSSFADSSPLLCCTIGPLQVDADFSVLRQSKDVWRVSRFLGDGFWLSVPIFVGDMGHFMLFLLLSRSDFSGEVPGCINRILYLPKAIQLISIMYRSLAAGVILGRPETLMISRWTGLLIPLQESGNRAPVNIIKSNDCILWFTGMETTNDDVPIAVSSLGIS